MEENNNKKKKKSVVDLSVILSFAVAIFAVFSIAMAGISLHQKSGVSYAAPAELPNSFTFNKLNGGAKVVSTNTDTGDAFDVPLYVANNDENNMIFCLERNTDVLNGEQYTKGASLDSEDDYGLLYLLNNSRANGVSIIGGNTNEDKYIDSWITQTAIWLYMYDAAGDSSKDSSHPYYLTTEELTAIKTANHLVYDADGTTAGRVELYTGENLYTAYVKPLLDKAKTASDVAKIIVTKENDEVTEVDLDNKEGAEYYQSALITVMGDPSSSLDHYSVELSGIEGAKAVDADGNELTDNITPSTKFYIRIPTDKVTKEVQNVVINVVGTFNTLEGSIYNAATPGLQRVVSVKGATKDISGGAEVGFVGTENTGMSTVQTIYFIGLIVLLCGVGIVYANAKPVQVKQ